MADFLPIRMRLDTLGWRRFDPCLDWFSPAGFDSARNKIPLDFESL